MRARRAPKKTIEGAENTEGKMGLTRGWRADLAAGREGFLAALGMTAVLGADGKTIEGTENTEKGRVRPPPPPPPPE